MNRLLKYSLLGVGGLVGAALVVPLLIPVPPLTDTVDPEDLADRDSLFANINGLRVHHKKRGTGEIGLLLLHGFGASTFSWRHVMEPLSRFGTVVAYDRPGLGLTSRPLPGEWDEENPYGHQAQVKLAIGLMDRLGIGKSILFGSSMGGTISVLTALEHPERVKAMVLVDPAVYLNGGPRWITPIFRLPQFRRIGPLIARGFAKRGRGLGYAAWHDPSKLDQEVWEGYLRPGRAKNWDRAFWELAASAEATDLAARLKEIRVPVLVVTGANDRIVPPPLSMRLARQLPNARLVVIPNCGHLPQEECPVEFMQAVESFLEDIQ